MTGAITDDRLWNYRIIDGGWRLSNSEGFARWFELRMKLAKVLMEKVALDAKIAKIDDLPAYRWKSPLQRKQRHVFPRRGAGITTPGPPIPARSARCSI